MDYSKITNRMILNFMVNLKWFKWVDSLTTLGSVNQMSQIRAKRTESLNRVVYSHHKADVAASCWSPKWRCRAVRARKQSSHSFDNAGSWCSFAESSFMLQTIPNHVLKPVAVYRDVVSSLQKAVICKELLNPAACQPPARTSVCKREREKREKAIARARACHLWLNFTLKTSRVFS